jgi:hypothetical protein
MGTNTLFPFLRCNSRGFPESVEASLIYLMSSSIHFFSSNMASSVAVVVFKPRLIIHSPKLKTKIRNLNWKFMAEIDCLKVFSQ